MKIGNADYGAERQVTDNNQNEAGLPIVSNFMQINYKQPKPKLSLPANKVLRQKVSRNSRPMTSNVTGTK
jgi:hypothetical protein